jgi:hypothetical protein
MADRPPTPVARRSSPLGQLAGSLLFPVLGVCVKISPGTRGESSRHQAAPAWWRLASHRAERPGLESGFSLMSMSGRRATDPEPCKTETR